MNNEEYLAQIEYFKNQLIKSCGIPRKYFLSKNELVRKERKEKFKKIYNEM